MRHPFLAACLSILLSGAAVPDAQPDAPTLLGSSAAPARFVHMDKGIRVEFSIEPVGRGPGPLREGDHADVFFRITDAASGDPISPLEPAAWIDLEDVARRELECDDRIRRYVQSTLTFQATIDLNKFFILVLNEDPSINVIDPILGVTGYTQHYAIIDLPQPGEDWVVSPGEGRLYVSMPVAGQVAVVDLESFKVAAKLEAGANPVRVAIQPDGRYLWVGNDGLEEDASGVTVIDPRAGTVAARIATGRGHHEIAFSDDSLFAYVTNSAAGTVTVVDTQRLAKVADLPTGENPVAVAYSPLAQAAYVGHEADGSVAVISRKRPEVVTRIAGKPGLVSFRFAPGGRWGFAVNVRDNAVEVVDASTNRVAHRVKVGAQPDRVAFTDTFAYVHHLGTPYVHMIQLSTLGGDGSVATQSVGFGTRKPGEVPLPAFADPIVPTGEWGTVVATNPADRLMYYYMEGMVTPMGSYSAYGHVPRAVGVIDRSLREVEKGVYGARVRLPSPGTYTAAFLLDAPWVDHCFSFTAEPDPALAGLRGPQVPAIEFFTEERQATVGQDFSLRFAVRRTSGGEAVAGLRDVRVTMTRAPWNWHRRSAARPLDDGTYEVTLHPDRPGVYYVFFGIPSLGAEMTHLRQFALRAVSAERKGQP